MNCDGYKDEMSSCKEKLRRKDKRSSPARRETTAGVENKKKKTLDERRKCVWKQVTEGRRG